MKKTLISIIAALTIATTGCEQKVYYDYKSPFGIEVYANGYTFPTNKVDSEALEVDSFIRARDRKPRYDFYNLKITIKHDHTNPDGTQGFKLQGKWYAGARQGDVLHLTPDFATYKHELKHWHGLSHKDMGE